MSEFSLFHTTGTSGDGASTYTQAQLTDWLRRTFINTASGEGVLSGYGGELAVTGTATPVSVASGAAYVYGFPYESTSAVTFAVPTPSIGTTAHRVVLRMDWSAHTVRLALKSSSDGVSTSPALTQTANTTWEIPIASLTITTGGVITVTDQRQYCHPNIRIATGNIDTSAVTTAKIADSNVTTAKIADSNVTTAKIADSNVTTAKIAAANVTLAKIAADALMRFAVIPIAVFDNNSVASTSQTSYEEVGYSAALECRFLLDKSKLPTGATVRFRAGLNIGGGYTAYAELYNVTDSASVSSSAVSKTQAGAAVTSFVESGNIYSTLASTEKTYTVRIKHSTGLSYTALTRAELIITW